MQSVKGRIGFFDSGVGGLTVLRACAPALDNFIYYYYGDVYRAPYGNLDDRTITDYAFQAFDRFLSLKLDAAVVACNTVTAVCIDKLRQVFPFPIVGTEPAVLSAAKHAAKQGGEIFVLTTRATFQSKRFQVLLEKAGKKYPTSIIRPFACDGLAGAIERGDGEYLSYLPRGNPSQVVLGCTHYVFIKDVISNFYGAPTVDGGQGVVNRLNMLLQEKKCDFADHFKPLIPDDCLFLPKNKQNPLHVCFIGDGKMVIKNKYEQMFAIK